jgi:branched-subunit amino acid aminotransferase/4-amino-4-deoxychorismate lyase
VRINGKPADTADLASLALYGYGSFTSLIVNAGRVRGLGLHMERLRHDSMALFGAAVAEQDVRHWLREDTAAAAGPVSARVTLFQRHFNMARPVDGPPDVLITTRPAPAAPPAPIRVATTRFVRDEPQVKHTGLFAQLHHRRAAQTRGFDDVLFLDTDNRVSEGATWNIAFATSSGEIVWPQAGVLPGVTMRLLQTALPEHGFTTKTTPVTEAETKAFPHVFATNAVTGIRTITAINNQDFTPNPQLEDALRACWTSVPTEEL